MTYLCNFCFKISNACSSLDETLKKKLTVIELVITESSKICEECIQRVHSSFQLKASTICNEELIVSYEMHRPKHEKLIDYYLIKNKMKCDVFPNELKICRFCITLVPDNSFNFLEDKQVDGNIREIIATHLPEVDFTITSNPIVCNTCLRKLQDYKTLISNWLEVNKLKFKNNIGSQHSDNYDIRSTNIKTELCTKEFENEEGENTKNIDCVVDNIHLKNEIEIHDEFTHSVEDDHIKSESVSSDDVEMEESKQKVEIFHFESKVESGDYVQKEEEISINDVKDDNEFIEFQDHSESISNTPSLCKNNQGIGQQKSNECSSSSEHKVPVKISKNSEFDLSSFKNDFPKMEQERLILSKEQIEQPMESRNSAFRSIKINDGFRCGFCSFENQSEAQIEEHFKNYHYSTYSCSLLDEINDEKIFNKFESHLIMHPDESNFYKCAQCVFKTKYKYALKRHLINHSDESIFYKCEHCDYKSKHKINLKQHLITHSDKTYKCEHCDYKSKQKSYLTTHLLMHSNEKYKCELCDFKCKQKRYLKTHLITHSNETYKCEHCDYEYKHKSNLKRHLAMHSNETYKCEHCDSEYKRKSNLKQHLAKHSNETYKCEHCDYESKYKHHLIRHLIRHTGQSNFYKCEHCMYKTKYKHALKRHLINHSDESIFYKCEHCDFESKHKNYLKTHLLRHCDECNFYKCEHCDYKSKHKSNLKQHLAMHSDSFYKCEHCNYKTKFKRSIKIHLLRHSDVCLSQI